MAYLIDAKFVAFIREVYAQWPRVLDATRRCLSINGPNVVNTPSGISIGMTPAPKARPAAAAAGLVRVRITANAAGGGKYYGYLVGASSLATIPASGDVSATELGQAASQRVLAINAQEEGQSTHALTAGTPICHDYFAVPARVASSEGDPVVIINALDITTNCTG